MRRPRAVRGGSLWLALLLLAAAPALAGTVSGVVFEDRNANGILDTGEPVLSGVTVGLYGADTSTTTFDQQMTTGVTGTFSFTPNDGCYLVDLPDPPGWRLAPTRLDVLHESTPGYDWPVGITRLGKMDHGADALRGGTFRFVGMGDSIAVNFNFLCNSPGDYWYSQQVRDRLACAAPAATVTLDEAAVKRQETDDLLVDDFDDLNNIFRVLALTPAPNLVTFSMIGNDLLNVDADNPTQQDINVALQEILDARRNLQEAVSVLLAEIDNVDIALNTQYDNLSYDCPSVPSGALHRTWIPIIARLVRELAWGQIRRASVAEVAQDMGLEGLAGTCSGFSGMICRDFLGLDEIHPNGTGYRVVREKVLEATGTLTLGSQDALARSSHTNVDYGFLQHVARVYPTVHQVLGGASASAPGAALGMADDLPAQIDLGIGQEEFRLSGFPGHLDDVEIVKVIAGVRYKTSGTVSDDFYRMEISPSGQFDPGSGFDYTPTNWNRYTPLVGGGGPNQPPLNPDYPATHVLVTPNVTDYREVSATLSKNPVVVTGADQYQWPALTHQDLTTTIFRLAAAPVAATSGDSYTVDIDTVWLDLYGWLKIRPQEVENLQVERGSGGALEVSFASVPSAQRYNLYFGQVASLRSGYDHGPGATFGPHCDQTTVDIGGGRRLASLTGGEKPAGGTYILATAHVSNVESPAGFSSANVEIDRAESSCP